MQIRKIALQNWRSVKHVEIGIADIQMFIGKNNHGKSNILYSLLFFYDKWECQESDFHNNSDELFVEISFADFSSEEKKRFRSYIDNEGVMTIRRHAKKGKSLSYRILQKEKGFIETNIDPAELGNILFIPALEKIKVRQQTSAFDQLLALILSNLWNQVYQKKLNLPRSQTPLTPLSPRRTSIRGEFQSCLQSLLEKVNREMREWGAEVSISFESAKKEMPEFSLEILVDDAAVSDVMLKGKGIERALVFAVFEALSQMDSVAKGLTNIIILFEEPELFLHPQAQNELFLALKGIAKNGIQIFITTHSSYFIDLTYHRSICIVHKKSLQEGTRVRQVLGDIFVSESDKKNFNMGYWINPDRGELFFAKKVILVEGPTEKVVLPKLAKKLGISHYEYTIIDCAGKSNMPLYITLLNAFQIPYVAVYDKDHQKYRSKKACFSAEEYSRFIQRKINPQLGGFVEFVNDVEEELQLYDHSKKHKPFSALQYINSSHFCIPKKLEEKLRMVFE